MIPAAAQETTGAIVGRVTDQTGAALPAVTVRVARDATGFAREVATAPSGTFVAALLAPGTYDLTFAGAGSARATVRDIALHAGDRLVVDAVLAAAESDRRWGSGERAVQLTPALQYVVAARQLEALPLINRHVAALVAVTPGVTSALSDEPSLGLFSGHGLVLGGGRSGPSGWFLDGVRLGTGGLLLTPSLESIEEVRVVAGTPAATWPRGAAAALVTRSGTNVWRASAYELRREGALDANSFFRNLGLDPVVRADPPDVRADIFGYSAGGPIRKDALFVFWSQEWRRRRGEAEEDALDGRQETARVDHRASAKWRLMGRYTHDAVEAPTERQRTAHVGVAQATAALSATTVNELSYRMAVARFLTSHALADTLSFQHTDHSLAVGGFVAREAGRTRYEAYVQDSWRPHRAVTVDVGVRRADGGWGPGVGVAWRPRARSDTTIRAGLAAPQASTPTRRWTFGIARRLYSRGAFDVAYLGARAEGLAREPEQRYDGLLGHFRHEGPAGLLDLAYTISRDRVRAGLDWDRELGDRRHVFTATWARDLRGFTIAGITNFQSGPPARAITRAGRSDVFARRVADPFVNLPSDRYYFSPAAFAPAAIGAPGSPLSPFSLPGRNQWDLAVSRAWRVGAAARLRLRADIFNVFNHTQFTGVDTICDAGPADTTCGVPNTTLGQYTSARAPRQGQLGIRVDWN